MIGHQPKIRKRPDLVRKVEIVKESRSGQDLHMIEVDHIDGYDHDPEDKEFRETEKR